MNSRILSIVSTTSLLSFTVGAADMPDVDKSAYSILNPTPSLALRPLRTDVADKVINPYTVDAGHFQLESDLLDFYGSDDQRYNYFFRRTSDEFVWEPRLKAGLCNNVDFELQGGYKTRTIHEEYSGVYPSRSVTLTDSFVSPKFKINLWGNDGGTTALAVAPFVSIPTEGNYDVMGGVELPFSVSLPLELTLKFTPDFYSVQDDYKNLCMGFNNSASLTRAITPNFDVFANLSTTVTTISNQEWYGYSGFGVAYTFATNFQVYGGIRFGLTKNSFDNNPYFGGAWRF